MFFHFHSWWFLLSSLVAFLFTWIIPNIDGFRILVSNYGEHKACIATEGVPVSSKRHDVTQIPQVLSLAVAASSSLTPYYRYLKDLWWHELRLMFYEITLLILCSNLQRLLSIQWCASHLLFYLLFFCISFLKTSSSLSSFIFVTFYLLWMVTTEATLHASPFI